MVDVEALREVADAMERAKAAGSAQDELQSLGVEVSRIRREAIEELIRGGMTKAAVGEALGMTRGRVSQLVTGGPAPERLFFGDGRLTVPMGGKLEAGKQTPGQVLAEEDVQTFTQLSRLLQTLELDADHEVVSAPGMINLNRDNLFVICGPRLSPMVSMILESDPFLGFAEDDAGWYLINKATGQEIRSPQDAGEPGDAAYFGRLPRPDGRGYFLYAAGIHAAGPRGVIHYLSGHLPALYRNVKRRRFSTLVGHAWDPETLQVTGSRLLSDVFVHEER